MTEKIRARSGFAALRKGSGSPPVSAASFALLLLCLFLIALPQAGAADRRKLSDQIVSKAVSYFDSKKFRQALPLLKQAAQVDPTNAEVHFALGKTYFYLDDKEQSVKEFAEGLRLNPPAQVCEYFRLWGHALVILDRPEEAIEAFNKGLHNMPRNAELFCERGCTYALMDDYAKGLPDLNEAIKIDPGRAHYYRERAMMYKQLKQYDKALADYTKQIQIEPHSSVAYVDRSLVYKKLGRFDLAQKDLNQSIKLNVVDIGGKP